MTSEANAKLPIQAWILDCCGGCGARLPLTDLGEEPNDGDWCKADDVRGLVERMERAEAQRDRLAEVLRLALELAKDQDDNLGSWAEVWAQADEALAAIEKENA